jgi:hypothetical protein
MIQSADELSNREHEYIEMCFDVARSNTNAVARLRHGAVLIGPKGSYAKERICRIQWSSYSDWSADMFEYSC